MSDLLIDLETYFTYLSLASTVNRDTVLDTPDSVVALYEYPGQSFGPHIAGAQRNVQILVRDHSAAAAKTKARELYNSLNIEDGILNLTNERWCTVQPMQPPFKMRVDDKNRVYYGFNVNFVTYLD